MYLITNCIFSGIIIYLLFSIILLKLKKDGIEKKNKPIGIKLSFFITGILLYLLSYFINFD